MIRKIALYITLSLLASSALWGQKSEVGKLLFRAMENEAKRGLDSLKIGDSPKPFYISYAITDKELLRVEGRLGAILYSNQLPIRRSLSTRVLVGSHQNSNLINFGTQFRTSYATIENSYPQLRRDLWESADLAYKEAATQFRQKRGSESREKGFPDFYPQSGKISFVESYDTIRFNRAETEKNVIELSSLFKEYPSVVESKVTYRGSNSYYYFYDTEGSKFNQPVGVVALIIDATIKDNQGVIHKDKLEYIASSPKDLPQIERVKEEIREMVASLQEFSNAQEIDEFYSGPILFEDRAVVKLFMESLFLKNGVVVKRDNIALRGGGRVSKKVDKSLLNRMGKKVIDTKLSLYDLSHLGQYRGKAIPGHLKIDAEGVVKNEPFTIIERGLLKGVLGDRMPADSGFVPTGNLRYDLLRGESSYTILPTYIKVEGERGKSAKRIYKEFLRLAASEGLEYAYIIRSYPLLREDSAPKIYRVNVKTKEEVAIKSAALLSQINLNLLKSVKYIAAKEKSYSFLYDYLPFFITLPSALIISDVELSRLNLERESKELISNPLVRQ
ncbi:MAG: metallopeptidase TldD-related protein [Bacteroidales bacterium]